MRRLYPLLICSVILLLGVFTVSSHSSTVEQTHPQWLVERIGEAKSIAAGMSRADLLRVFEQDGGLNSIPARRYVLRSCRYIKVDVEFDITQGSYSRAMPDESLRISSISEPYLGYIVTD
jgi:hypothetical protein